MKRIVIRAKPETDEDGYVYPGGYVSDGGAPLTQNIEEAKVFFADSKRTKERFLRYTDRYEAVPVRIVLDV